MELPQPCQFGITEGRKPTHDFLSLCSHSSAAHQDPIPPSQGGRLKTLDLLHVGKASTIEEKNMKISSAGPVGEEHVLPGGIGTYSISHVSYINNAHQRPVPIKPEGSMFNQQQQHQSSSTTDQRNDEHSNCSSYTGSGFTLWEESVANNKKGKTGKENLGERSNVNIREAPGGTNPRQWGSAGERPTQSSAADNRRHSFSSHPQASGQQRSQSFMDMLISAKNGSQEEESDDNEELVIKKENSAPLIGELRADGKSTDQKANTPRSKHSATEQRRRSKINDRFQALRGLIPHSDQKRDKASFLLEVIEYIQFLQEKVHKYEGPYQGLNKEPVKSMPWRNNQGPAENLIDHSRARNISSGPVLMFPNEKNFTAGLNIPGNTQKAESGFSSANPSKATDYLPGITNNKIPFPVSPNLFNSVQNSCFLPPQKQQSDAENMLTQSQPHLFNSKSCTSDGAVSSDKMKEKDLTVESGRINISSIYSQGLLNTLTQALQSSGVDLSQANVSVQIELGKRGIGKTSVPSNQGMTRSRMATDEDCDQLIKKLKAGKS